MRSTPQARDAVDALFVQHAEPLHAFAERLTDGPGTLLARARTSAVGRYALDEPGALGLPWLLRLVAVAHTHREPRPSADVALLSAYAALPQDSRAVLWHVAVEGQDAATAGAALRLAPAVVDTSARSAAAELRTAVLDQYDPSARPDECQWLHRRELEAPSLPLTRGELARASRHSNQCLWCGDLEDQLALAGGDLRSVIAVSVLGSLAPIYLATRPEPVIALTPPVPPPFTGVRRAAAENQRPLIGVGALTAIAAGIAGVVLVQPVLAPSGQVFSADGALVEVRDTGRTGEGDVAAGFGGGVVDETPAGDAVVPAPGPGTPADPTGGSGDGSGDGNGGGDPGGGGNGGDNGGDNGGGNPGGGNPGGGDNGGGDNGGGPGGPGDGGTPPTQPAPRLIDLGIGLDPIGVDVGLGTAPLLGSDQKVRVGLDVIAVEGLIDLRIPLLGSRQAPAPAASAPAPEATDDARRAAQSEATATGHREAKGSSKATGPRATGPRPGKADRSRSAHGRPSASTRHQSRRSESKHEKSRGPERRTESRRSWSPRPDTRGPSRSSHPRRDVRGPSTKSRGRGHSRSPRSGPPAATTPPAEQRPGLVRSLLRGLLGGG